MDYRYIRAWSKMMGHYPPQLAFNLAKAASDNPPIDAIFFRNSRWYTFSEITRPDTREIMGKILATLPAESAV